MREICERAIANNRPNTIPVEEGLEGLPIGIKILIGILVLIGIIGIATALFFMLKKLKINNLETR
jgi:hypothetical protein